MKFSGRPLPRGKTSALARAHGDGAAGTLFLMIVASGAPMAGGEFWWLAAAVGTVGVGIAVWINWVRPSLRRVRLKHPVKAHFTSRDNALSMSGRDVSDGDPHLIRCLTTPANHTLEIELGFMTRIPFKTQEIVIGCKGDPATRPHFLRRTFSFQGGTRPVTNLDYIDPAGYFHIKTDKVYSVGAHFVIQMDLQTLSAGRYPVVVSFLTDEIEGNFEDLEILVESTPSTNMRCHAKGHGLNCTVRAAPLSVGD